MATLTKGEIVLFPFPYTDLSEIKIRPCLVISEQMGKDVILCQITSREIPSDNYSIELEALDTIDGSLSINSYIRCNMIFTAARNKIIKKLCKVNSSKYSQVVSLINKIIK